MTKITKVMPVDFLKYISPLVDAVVSCYLERDYFEPFALSNLILFFYHCLSVICYGFSETPAMSNGLAVSR